jgi:hypothetical protein
MAGQLHSMNELRLRTKISELVATNEELNSVLIETKQRLDYLENFLLQSYQIQE